MLDKTLFVSAQRAYDQTQELENIRRSFISYVLKEDGTNSEAFSSGFSDYAKGELEDIRSALTDLYTKCTGKKEIQLRLR
jgi:hypothetical protein